MSDEDDKATVVINLSQLKKEQEKNEQEMSKVVDNLEFNLSSEAESEEIKPTVPGSQRPVVNSAPISTLPVVMFEFEKNHFAKIKDHFPSQWKFHFANTLPELNGWLKKKIPFVVCLPLDVNPKAINQLCVQLRAKYPHVHVIVVSKALTADKIEIHRKSAAKAFGYVGYPFSKEQITSILDKITQPKAA